jgi:hypothetical protein
MAKTAFKMVASSMIPVVPSSGKDGYKQPPYARGKHTFATSARLLRYRSCVARGMAGSSAGGRPAIQDKFASVASSCRGK